MDSMKGEKPKRSKSPSTRKNQRKNVPSRRPDSSTEDFIKFVREHQMGRQPTFTGLHKKAPLPEIGQSLSVGLNDSGFLDKLNDDYEDIPLENGIIYGNKLSIPKNDKIIKEVLTITRQQTRDCLFTSGRSGVNNDNFVLTRQRSNLSNFHRTWSLPQTRQIKHMKTLRPKQSLKQLPPLLHDDLPTRPTAPSPSRTPPLEHSDNSSEDLIEFLDLS